MSRAAASSLFTAALVGPAVGDAFKKLSPRQLVRNPVMFVTAVVALLLTVLLFTGGAGPSIPFQVQIVVWLWLTVLFGNFAEAIAEGRGKAQAASLRQTKGELTAKLMTGVGRTWENVPASRLKVGDTMLVETGDLIPADGEVIQGVASVNEAAITGESAPVVREAGGDRSAVTAGTRVISDEIVVRVTAGPGEGFLDRMIALVEGASRQKTPNEIALTILLVGLTIIFLIAVGTVPMFAAYAGRRGAGRAARGAADHADPNHDRGAAQRDRHRRHGPAGALQRARQVGPRGRGGGRHRRAAARQDRHDHGRRPSGDRVSARSAVSPWASWLRPRICRASPTKRPRAARSSCWRASSTASRATMPADAEIIAFSAATRLSGLKFGDTIIQKGAVDSVLKLVPASMQATELSRMTDEIARSGGTPLAVIRNGRILGAVHLKDIVKAGIRERFAELRRMGIRTVMITGDNPADRGEHRRRGRASTISSPRRRPRTSWRISARSRSAGGWWRCAATAPTTRPRWRRPMSA